MTIHILKQKNVFASSNVDRALSRPEEYEFLSSWEKRRIDFKLGLTDWIPTATELAELTARWRERYDSLRNR